MGMMQLPNWFVVCWLLVTAGLTVRALWPRYGRVVCFWKKAKGKKGRKR